MFRNFGELNAEDVNADRYGRELHFRDKADSDIRRMAREAFKREGRLPLVPRYG